MKLWKLSAWCVRMECSVFRQCQLKKCVVLLFIFLACQNSHYGHAKPVEGSKKQTKIDDIRANDLLEGDIVMSQSVWDMYTNATQAIGSKRSAVTDGIKLWSNGVVPYTINNQLGYSARNAISGAIAELNRKTCIRFRARKNEYSYVEFIKGSGCYSYVGRVGGRQVVSLGSGCDLKGIALHEMIHTLGFFHTNSRADRDAYVTVYENNVATGYLGNFHRYSHGQIDHLGSPYDITSIMHLPRDAFAKRKSLYTIVARAGPHIVLGQKIELSSVDNYQVNALYKCSSISGCLNAQGLQSGNIPDTAMRASSAQKYRSPGQGRLHNRPNKYGMGAWCPSYTDVHPWIQVDLGHNIRVTGIATQGYTNLYRPMYVMKYSVEYRKPNSRYWTTYKTSMLCAYGYTQELPGNWDDNSVQYNALTPTFVARYVRIMPRSWILSPCFRIEIFGCRA